MERRSFFFDDELYERLRKFAQNNDTPMSEVVREAVKKEIDERTDKLAD